MLDTLSTLPLNQIALSGYALLFAFSLYKLSDTFRNPIDLFANILLLVGLAALMTYHYRVITTKKDETNDESQKQVRMVAHTTLSAFFLLTLLELSQSNFQFYDSFGLTAHMYLTYAVSLNASQLPGVGLLALYFAFASYQKMVVRATDLDIITLVGRLLLLFYFSVSFANGVAPMMK